jgi:hypothetical protein
MAPKINITYCITANLGQLSRYSYSAMGWTIEESWLQSQQEQKFLLSKVCSLALDQKKFLFNENLDFSSGDKVTGARS